MRKNGLYSVINPVLDNAFRHYPANGLTPTLNLKNKLIDIFFFYYAYRRRLLLTLHIPK